MSEIFLFLFLILFAYFLGSIPFAYIIVKIVNGTDIRTVGSGNVGATNVARVLGKWGFASVLILDMLKGFTPTLMAIYFLDTPWKHIIVSLFAILGHTYTIFLKFRGGKGVATAGGVCLALIPLPTLLALIVFCIVFFWKRMVSLGSIVAALALLVFTIVLDRNLAIIIFVFIISAFIIYKHRENIKRILNGTESSFKRKKDE